MARTDPCLENQSVEEIITIAFVSTYLFKVTCAGPVPTAAQTVGRFFYLTKLNVSFFSLYISLFIYFPQIYFLGQSQQCQVMACSLEFTGRIS